MSAPALQSTDRPLTTDNCHIVRRRGATRRGSTAERGGLPSFPRKLWQCVRQANRHVTRPPKSERGHEAEQWHARKKCTPRAVGCSASPMGLAVVHLHHALPLLSGLWPTVSHSMASAASCLPAGLLLAALCGLNKALDISLRSTLALKKAPTTQPWIHKRSRGFLFVPLRLCISSLA